MTESPQDQLRFQERHYFGVNDSNCIQYKRKRPDKHSLERDMVEFAEWERQKAGELIDSRRKSAPSWEDVIEEWVDEYTDMVEENEDYDC